MKLMPKDFSLNTLDSSLSSSSALTQKQLKEILHYNPNTGVFTWRSFTTKFAHMAGVAGSQDSDGYIRIGVNGKKYRAHRLAWLYVHGAWPENEIDLINGIRIDSRISNLREATRTENSRNCVMQKNNTSGVKGVVWNKQKGKWQAQCWINGKNRCLGRFTDITEADQVVRQFREQHHGEFANHGDNTATRGAS